MSFKKIKEFVEEKRLIQPHQKIIIGLSGGPDSLYLLYFLRWLQKTMPITLIAAHLDHEWRKNSAADLLFCEKLCRSLDIPFIGARASQLPVTIKMTGSKEDHGRQLRRYFFNLVKEKYNADAIALAQHQDDQLETFFIRLARGTTVSGLSCMRPQHGDYIRPLLHITKKEILAYLGKHEIAYLTDPTNVSLTFLRNRIRLELVPLLQKIDPRFEKNIIKTIDSMQNTDDFLRTLAQDTLNKISVKKDKKRIINLKNFLALDLQLQKKVLLEWLYEAEAPFTISTGLIDEIIRFLNNKKNTTHQIDTWYIIKKNGKFYCAQPGQFQKP